MKRLNKMYIKLGLFFILVLFFFTIYYLINLFNPDSFDRDLKSNEIFYFSILNQFGFYRSDIPTVKKRCVKILVILQLFTAFVLYVY
jgi:hypothetical protein